MISMPCGDFIPTQRGLKMLIRMAICNKIGI